MIRQLNRWLGKERSWLLIGALIATGLGSVAITVLADNSDWALPAQTLLVIIFLGVAGAVVGSKLPPPARLKLGVTIGPALGLALAGMLVSSEIFPLMLGLAFGWLLAAQFIIRDRMPTEYKASIKALRREDYSQAVKSITELIDKEPKNANHYHFRAALNRLGGQTSAAIHDYRKVVELLPDRAMGYHGLSEIYLQQGKFENAHTNAKKAYELEPNEWVGPYNLGMIEDRLGNSQAVIDNLAIVINKGLPDSRHRLLTYLWMARAHHQLGDNDAANEDLAKLRKEQKGLKDWKVILDDVQGQTVRDILGKDVDLARRAIDNQANAQQLFGSNTN